MVVSSNQEDLSLQDIRNILASKLPHYQLPSYLVNAKEIPKNAMGKVNKKQLISYFTNK